MSDGGVGVAVVIETPRPRVKSSRAHCLSCHADIKGNFSRCSLFITFSRSSSSTWERRRKNICTGPDDERPAGGDESESAARRFLGTFLRRLCLDAEKRAWMQTLTRSDWIPGVGVRAREEKRNPSRNTDFFFGSNTGIKLRQ